jgi:hypothetical protein
MARGEPNCAARARVEVEAVLEWWVAQEAANYGSMSVKAKMIVQLAVKHHSLKPIVR